jgi:hypothetical protein
VSRAQVGKARPGDPRARHRVVLAPPAHNPAAHNPPRPNPPAQNPAAHNPLAQNPGDLRVAGPAGGSWITWMTWTRPPRVPDVLPNRPAGLSYPAR